MKRPMWFIFSQYNNISASSSWVQDIFHVPWELRQPFVALLTNLRKLRQRLFYETSSIGNDSYFPILLYTTFRLKGVICIVFFCIKRWETVHFALAGTSPWLSTQHNILIFFTLFQDVQLGHMAEKLTGFTQIYVAFLLPTTWARILLT